MVTFLTEPENTDEISIFNFGTNPYLLLSFQMELFDLTSTSIKYLSFDVFLILGLRSSLSSQLLKFVKERKAIL